MYSKTKIAFFTIALVFGVFTGNSQAAVVKFENLVPEFQGLQATAGPDTIDGMVFSYIGETLFLHNYHTIDPEAPDDPTGTIFNYDRGQIHMERVDHSTFSLSSFDAAIYYGKPSGRLEVFGLWANGNFTDALFDVTQNSFQTFSFDSTWTDLKYVDITMLNTNFMQYDNIVYDAYAVPEPASLALISLGLLGFGASRRKSAK